jgi:hypothetical protein
VVLLATINPQLSEMSAVLVTVCCAKFARNFDPAHMVMDPG